jgi:large subunit ribosomal protein L31
MKPGIHPNYVEVNVSCVCGNAFKTGTTKGQDLRTEICSACHPFFTGTQKIVDTEGRVERFMKKFDTANQLKAAASKRVALKDAVTPKPSAPEPKAAAPAPEPKVVAVEPKAVETKAADPAPEVAQTEA